MYEKKKQNAVHRYVWNSGRRCKKEWHELNQNYCEVFGFTKFPVLTMFKKP